MRSFCSVASFGREIGSAARFVLCSGASANGLISICVYPYIYIYIYAYICISNGAPTYSRQIRRGSEVERRSARRCFNECCQDTGARWGHFVIFICIDSRHLSSGGTSGTGGVGFGPRVYWPVLEGLKNRSEIPPCGRLLPTLISTFRRAASASARNRSYISIAIAWCPFRAPPNPVPRSWSSSSMLSTRHTLIRASCRPFSILEVSPQLARTPLEIQCATI